MKLNDAPQTESNTQPGLTRKLLKAFKAQFIQLGSGCANLLLPNLCPGCDRLLKTNTFPICPRCTFYLDRVEESKARASVCKLPQACDAFKHIFSLWMFDKAGTVQRIHQGLKYKNRPYYGITLGKLMGTAFLLPLHPVSRPHLIIPVPLHRRRLLERGFNQSDLLAQGMATATNIPMSTDVLIRSSYTQTQTGFDKSQRLQNVYSAFSVNKHCNITDCEITSRHILLVDDVLTTGATLLAASLPLKEAGAGEISIATLALARS